METHKKLMVLAAVLAFVALSFGADALARDHYSWDDREDVVGGARHDSMTTMAAKNDAADDKDKAVVYTCPMHPQVQANEPGRCPICGMDLVPQKPAK